MKQPLDRPLNQRKEKKHTEYVRLVKSLVHVCGLDGIRFAAMHASSSKFLQMVEEHFECEQCGAQGEFHPTPLRFEDRDFASYADVRVFVESDANLDAPAIVFKHVVDNFSRDANDPSARSSHLSEFVLALMGREALPTLCEIVQSPGRESTQLLAIDGLVKLFWFVLAAEQDEIEAALASATASATNKKVAAALAAALKEIRREDEVVGADFSETSEDVTSQMPAAG